MTDLDLNGLALFPAPTLLLLVVGFAVATGAFGVQPGLEEGGRVEVGLDVADDLGGGYAAGFVDCWRGGRDRVSGVDVLGTGWDWNPTVPKTPSRIGPVGGEGGDMVDGVARRKVCRRM